MSTLSRPQVAALVLAAGGDPNVLTVVGIRGADGSNQIGTYDDEIYVISPVVFQGFKGNTDPSRSRAGSGFGGNKGMAHLVPGLYHAHVVGKHRGKYTALIQGRYSPGGEVTVRRDGNPPYLDKGWFGINIHHGSYNSTSSLGCQTVHPDQWSAFINLVLRELARLGQKVVPYLLHDNSGVVPSTGLEVRRTGTLNNGVEGEPVRQMQHKLNIWAAAQPTRPFAPLVEDGDFGDGTEAAVKLFQKAKGLDDDGVAGTKTLGALG